MNQENISVIVPVYNGEKYIHRCIESVINQSYKNVELIIVDDNSYDSSYEIINHYRENYNIKYIKNKQNLGPAKSRNIGLEYATSKYVLFLDCDDWIDLNCLEKAINMFDSNPEIDIVVWEIKTAFYYDKISSRYEYLYNNILTSRMALELLSHTIENIFFLSPLLGCKLFKKNLLDKYKINFPDTIYEDDMFTYLAFMYAKKVALVSGCCLYYYQHSSSLTHHFTQKNVIDFFATFNQLYNYIDNTQKESYYRYLTKSLNAMINNMISTVEDTDEQIRYKILIFTSFYQNINIYEYYTYSFSLTI